MWHFATEVSELALQQNTRIEILAIDSISKHDPRHGELEEKITLFADGLDGLICVGALTQKAILPIFARLNKPCLIWGGVSGYPYEQLRTIQEQKFHIIRTNYEQAGLIATETLIEEGHKRIGFITEFIEPGLCFAQWQAGYFLAHHNADFDTDSSLIQITGPIEHDNIPAVDTYLAMDEPPTAYVIPNPLIAAAFIGSMEKKAKKPDKNNVITCLNMIAAERYGLNVISAENYGIGEYRQIGRKNESLQKCLKVAIQQCKNPDDEGCEILMPIEANFEIPRAVLCRRRV